MVKWQNGRKAQGLCWIRERCKKRSKEMIDLYYWPTPNGHKVTIQRREGYAQDL